MVTVCGSYFRGSLEDLFSVRNGQPEVVVEEQTAVAVINVHKHNSVFVCVGGRSTPLTRVGSANSGIAPNICFAESSLRCLYVRACDSGCV